MSVVFTGGWNKLKQFIANSGKHIVHAMRSPAEQLTVEVKEDFFRRMKSNPPPALKQATVSRKKAKGSPYHSQTWIETEWLLNNLVEEAVVVHQRRNNITIGFQFTAKIHPSNLPAINIFSMLEFGNSRQPARPVLGPLFKDVRNKVHPAAQKFTNTSFDAVRRMWREI